MFFEITLRNDKGEALAKHEVRAGIPFEYQYGGTGIVDENGMAVLGFRFQSDQQPCNCPACIIRNRYAPRRETTEEWTARQNVEALKRFRGAELTMPAGETATVGLMATVNDFPIGIDPPQPSGCTCPIATLMTAGCKCGAMRKE